MPPIRERILDKLEELPEYSLREVLDFVEFLAWKKVQSEQNGSSQNEDPLLSVLGIMPGKPLTSREIDEALYGPYMNPEEDGSK